MTLGLIQGPAVPKASTFESFFGYHWQTVSEGPGT